MSKRTYTDRSRIETYQRCKRQRFLEYSEGGIGIVPARKALPLVVGGAVHAGIAHMLAFFVSHPEKAEDLVNGLMRAQMAALEDEAVTVALEAFADEAGGGLELDLTERTAMAPAGGFEEYQKQLAASLGTTPEEAGLEQLAQRHAANLSEFDRYLQAEQAALVEGMVRAYARRRLRPLLEQFEVLEVEREGMWKLSESIGQHGMADYVDYSKDYELWFMSRPDALLRERATNQLYILSLKTTGQWDIRKERDAQHDMQGLSEGVEVERRLAEWWEHRNDPLYLNPLRSYLQTCPVPPRILAIRYEYLLKGERWKDKELSARLGLDVRTQRSPLIRHYCAVSVPQRGAAQYHIGDSCWSWDYIKEDGSAGSLAWQNWKSQAVWETWGSVKAWVDALDDSAEAMSGYDSTVGLEPRALGWKSRAQALGYTAQHPLDSVFVPPIVVYRNDDELRDWVEQVEAQERAVAKASQLVAQAQDEGEKRHLLNVYFPMTRRACEYPSTCAFVKLCFGGEDLRRDPMASGQYTRRVPNHPVEADFLALRIPENGVHE